MKILIIKLGAKGDVIRTLPLAKALGEKYKNSQITWITKENSIDLLKDNKFIDIVYSIKNYKEEEYDLLYNFDLEEEACDIAGKIKSKKKFGFYKEGEFVSSYNFGAEYYLNTTFDDELKKKNRKTYQEMMFGLADLDYKKQFCEIELNEKEIKYGVDFLKENGIKNKKIIGIHMGASKRWPSKIWGEDRVKEFITQADKKGYSTILFGGPDEKELQEKMFNELKKNGIKVYRNNPHNKDREFAALVNLCSFMVCSDSFSLHVALSLRKNTIGLFFCTSPWEVEDYGLLRKICAKKLEEFFPQKMDQYNEELVNSISGEEVFEEINRFNEKRVVNAIIKKKNENEFLIIKRKENDKIHPGKWAFAGGELEKNETSGEALEREVKEETNLVIAKIIKKISEYEYMDEERKTKFGECFQVLTVTEDYTPGKEIAQIRWASLEELKKLEHIEEMEGELLVVLKEGNK